jgi:signal transduction histidine kinase
MRHRSTIRIRLTLLYSALFSAAGAVLLAVTYGLVANSLNGTSSQRPLPSPNLLQNCQHATKGLGVKPSPNTAQKCKEAFNAGVSAGVDQQHQQVLNHLLVYSVLALVGMVVISGVLGWLVAGRVLRPVQEITAAVRRLSAASLDQRLNFDGPRDELRELADTFDEMLGRLDRAFENQRQFVANASHELRTPLTIMRTEVEVALDRSDATPEDLIRMGNVVRDAVARSERLVDGLLLLAQSNQTLDQTERVDLSTLVTDVVAGVRALAEQRALTLICETTPLTVSGHAALLEQLVENLLDNAVSYNRPGGWVTVSLRGSPDPGATAVLSVANSGAEIPPDLVGGLFEPFRRLGTDRVGHSGGSGLGLSIVRSIASVHGGVADATALSGGGLRVDVMLPVPAEGPTPPFVQDPPVPARSAN